MPGIKHVMYEKKLADNFKSANAILNEIPYEPEILFLGTFNPNTPRTNFADFFYGRNYFWPAMKNLFIYKESKLRTTRMARNGKTKNALNPTLDEILIMCKNFKFTFADLIIEVFQSENCVFNSLENDNICYEGKVYNLIQDDKKGQILGLAQLDKLNQVNWNTENIIQYLINNPKIKTIYFTRQPKGIWKKQIERIITDKSFQGRVFTNIFTPSGQGKPVLNSMERLLNHWVHNENPLFGKLDNKWLSQAGIDLTTF